MGIRKLIVGFIFFILLTFSGSFFSCTSVDTPKCSYTILAVLAHPDDETLISGTLAELIDQGCNVSVVYTTSGDDGPDMTGQGLEGDALAEVREKETLTSLNHIGVANPPLFLKFPDSHVDKYTREIEDTLIKIFRQIDPDVVISFGPDGITNDLDHIATGSVSDQVFDSIHGGKLLLHMAISRKASYIYPIPAPVEDHLIDMQVDVSDHKRIRFKSNNAHRTQFGFGNRLFWKIYVLRFPFEEFVIVYNHSGEQIIQDCF